MYDKPLTVKQLGLLNLIFSKTLLLIGRMQGKHFDNKHNVCNHIWRYFNDQERFLYFSILNENLGASIETKKHKDKFEIKLIINLRGWNYYLILYSKNFKLEDFTKEDIISLQTYRVSNKTYLSQNSSLNTVIEVANSLELETSKLMTQN